MMNDSKLLNDCNVTIPHNGIWAYEDFTKCEDRLFGVVARWIYIFGRLRHDDNISVSQSVSLLGYDDIEKNSITNAIRRMKRIYTDNLSQADLVFSNFRVGTNKLLIHDQLKILMSKLSSKTIVIVRCGFHGSTTAIENLTAYYMSTFMDIYSFFKEANVIFGQKVVCTLPEKRYKHPIRISKNIVSLSEGNMEEWLPLSLSNEDIWDFWNSTFDYTVES